MLLMLLKCRPCCVSALGVVQCAVRTMQCSIAGPSPLPAGSLSNWSPLSARAPARTWAIFRTLPFSSGCLARECRDGWIWHGWNSWARRKRPKPSLVNCSRDPTWWLWGVPFDYRKKPLRVVQWPPDGSTIKLKNFNRIPSSNSWRTVFAWIFLC